MKFFTLKRTVLILVLLVCVGGVLIFVNSLSHIKISEANKAVQLNLFAIQRYALQIYPAPELYEDVCTDEYIARALVAAEGAGNGKGVCNASILGWAISVPLYDSGYYCIDSRGVDIRRSHILGIDVQC